MKAIFVYPSKSQNVRLKLESCRDESAIRARLKHLSCVLKTEDVSIVHPVTKQFVNLRIYSQHKPTLSKLIHYFRLNRASKFKFYGNGAIVGLTNGRPSDCPIDLNLKDFDWGFDGTLPSKSPTPRFSIQHFLPAAYLKDYRETFDNLILTCRP